MEIAEWLHGLGLGQYAAAFKDNHIDAALLTRLTVEDLRELGVESIGHRRQLLDAIAALRRPPAGGGIEDDSHGHGERRHVTVMFCDLVGSTEMSARLDPEDLAQIMRGYQDRVREPVSRFDGYIARYVGDGVLIYFGWPQSDETDAERAVRAALAIVEAMSASPVHGETLRVRIGIATGIAFIGETVGAGAARQHIAAGETPNLAARLQAVAEAGQVVIDAATRRLIAGLFECEQLEPLALRGFPAPVQAWLATREHPVESRFEALRGGATTPLLGREEELAWMQRCWQMAVSGEGQVVLLAGDPGIGKSRLLTALEEHLRDEPHDRLQYFCSPHHQETALYPVIARWEREAGFASADTAAARFGKLEDLLLRTGAPAEDIALIADLLGLSADPRYPPLTFGPQRKKEKTLEALSRSFVRRARRLPVLMVCEDMHWADPSSLDLLDHLIGTIAELPVLLVTSYRPEFIAPWVGRAGVTLLTLNRLGRRHARQLASHVAGQRCMPPALLDRIVEQADGMPLLLEELTRAVLDTAGQEPARLPETGIPSTLEASLLARLDRMPVAKRVAQIGAVIGREFTHGILAAVAELPETELEQGLRELVAGGLVFRRGIPPDAVYTFKHALLVDAAYRTVLRAHRRQLHRRAAGIIEAGLPEVAQLQPEVLAHHYAAAREDLLAAEWWLAAGDLAAKRYAHVEARSQYQKALDALGEAADMAANQRPRIDATVKHTAVSFAALSPHEHLGRLQAVEPVARALVAAPGATDEDALRLARVSLWLGRTLHYLSRLQEALPFYHSVLDTTAAASDDELVGTASAMIGRVLSIQGRFGEAAGFLSRALDVLSRKGIVSEYIWALSFLGLTDATRGDYAAGLARAERARRMAVERNFPTGLAASQILSWGIHWQGANVAGMLEAARAIVDVSERTGDSMYVYMGYGMLAWAETLDGNPESGVRHLERSNTIRVGLGGQAVLADWFSAFHAELLLRLGRIQEAIEAAEAATREAMAIGDIFAEAMARRTWAVARTALNSRNLSEAEAQLERSLLAFQAGEARVEVARTRLIWAVLHRRRGTAAACDAHLRHAEALFGASRMADELRNVEAVLAVLRD